MMKIKDMLDFELKDDETATGGISFAGETVQDFIDGLPEFLNEESTIKELNKALKECGIKEIKKGLI